MAFSILWTLAILVPDESSSNMSRRQHFVGLDGDGNHYVLDTSGDQTSAGKEFRVIHLVKSSAKMKSPTSVKVKRVSPITCDTFVFNEDSDLNILLFCHQRR